mgnify:CR=1 FL=1
MTQSTGPIDLMKTQKERGRGTMIRSEVQRFAEEREKQLQANEHKGEWEDVCPECQEGDK